MAACGAETAILVVLGGNKGNGFSVVSIDPDVERVLPRLLRALADEIEQ
jgi:hypothetical protein